MEVKIRISDIGIIFKLKYKVITRALNLLIFTVDYMYAKEMKLRSGIIVVISHYRKLLVFRGKSIIRHPTSEHAGEGLDLWA
jgi:hypothetical protein